MLGLAPFYTLQLPYIFRVLTFRKSDTVFLAQGPCHGTVGTFLNFRDDDPKWARIFLSGLHRFVHTWSNGSNICRGRVKLMTNHNELPSMGCSDDRVRSEDSVYSFETIMKTRMIVIIYKTPSRNVLWLANFRATLRSHRLRCSALVLPRCNRPVPNVLQSTMPLKAERSAD